MNTTLRIHARALVAAPLLALAGCASTPHVDASFGDAVRAAVASQVADPGAARNANPVHGIDGRAARASQERYERSYKEPQQQMAAPAAMVTSP